MPPRASGMFWDAFESFGNALEGVWDGACDVPYYKRAQRPDLLEAGTCRHLPRGQSYMIFLRFAIFTMVWAMLFLRFAVFTMVWAMSPGIGRNVSSFSGLRRHSDHHVRTGSQILESSASFFVATRCPICGTCQRSMSNKQKI